MMLLFWAITVVSAGAWVACASMTEPLEFGAAKELWCDAGISNYSMVLVRECGECLPGLETGPVHVVVEKGAVVSRVYVSSNEPVTGQFAELFPNIEGLFALIEEAERRGQQRVEVEYHERLGYPVRLRISSRFPDDVVGYTVNEFQPE